MRLPCRTPLLITLLVLAFTAVAGVASTEDHHLQELFLSPLAYTQERAELQIAVRSSFGAGETNALAIEYGLTNRLQIEAGSGMQSETGWTPLSFGLKYRPSAAWLRGTAFGMEISPESGERSVETYAVVSREFRQVQWLAHVAPSFDRGGMNEWQFGGTSVIALGRGYLTAELVWKRERGEEATAAFAPGVAWPVGDLFEVAISANFARNGKHGVLAGIRLNTSLGDQ